MQAAFFKKAGPGAKTLKEMMDVLPDVCFNMQDTEGRIMALNKRNCDLCNIHDELDAIGLKSSDLFPNVLSLNYMEHDQYVLRTDKPILNKVCNHNADRSNDYHIKSIFPLHDCKGLKIGTACIYYSVPSVEGAPDWHARLSAVTEHISANFAEDVTMERLASIAGTSPSNLRRQFLRILGISPIRYITTIRLNAVRKLLETTDKLVSDIAVETGFWDQSHLTKLFKRERGITPGEYRRKHRQACNPIR